MFPSFISANTITLLGQLPLLGLLLYVFWSHGANVSPDNLIDPKLLIVAGILVESFSQLDIMDGLRARRMKVGSPLGRLIDEGGDCIVMSNYCCLLAYLFCFDNMWWELPLFYLNLAFYGMEIRYKICNSLVMVVGELSSVEVEMMLSLCFLFGGYYGCESLQKSVGEQFELEQDSYFAIIAQYRVASVLGCFFNFL